MIRPLALSPPGSFASWLIRPFAVSPPRRFAPWVYCDAMSAVHTAVPPCLELIVTHQAVDGRPQSLGPSRQASELDLLLGLYMSSL